MREYTRPEIRSIQSADILEVLGPVSAGSPFAAGIQGPDPVKNKPGKKH